MSIPTCSRGLIAVFISAALSGALAGCSLEEQSAPAFTGPSEFATSVTVTASPAQLPRDGSSQSDVTVTVRNVSGSPVQGQGLRVSADIGTVSQDLIVTSSDGRASFTYTAPPSATVGSSALVQVVPTSTTGDAVARFVTIALSGTLNRTLPTPLFSVDKFKGNDEIKDLVLRQAVVFDASDTTDEGVKCNDTCTYAWDFGDGGTASGRVVTHQFTTVRTYPVKLTVTDGAGATASLTKNVPVGQGTAPAASISASPSSAQILETVAFSAQGSTVGQAGRTITSYEWRFGDGETATGVTATHSYSVTGTYQVVLTVTDSAGLQGTATKDVTVANDKITAAFTISPTEPLVGQTVYFNAESTVSRSSISKYYWNFGASTSVTETTSPLTSTSYSVAGTYTITLTVEDSAGRKATVSKTVEVVEVE